MAMDIGEMYVAMAAMAMIVAVIALLTRLIAAALLNRTIREALRTDPGSVSLLAERLDRHPPWATRCSDGSSSRLRRR